jgi:hypothetical protein
MGLTSRSTIRTEWPPSAPFVPFILDIHFQLTLPPAGETRLQTVPPHSSLLGCRTA